MIKVQKEQAVKLLVAAGAKKAITWDDEKIVKALNKIGDKVDSEFTTDSNDLDLLLDKCIDNRGKIKLAADDEDLVEPVPTAKKKKAGKKATKPSKGTKKRKKAAKEPTAKPKKKTTKKTAKKKAAKKEPVAEKKIRGVGVVATIISMLEKGPVKKLAIHKVLVKKFPERDADAMLRTVQNFVPAGLKYHKKINVIKDGDKYHIKTKK